MKPTTADIVNDFIHETYLETLDEHGIVGDLEHFSEICGQAISETIHDGQMIVELNQRLREIRQAQTLAADQEEPGWGGTGKPRTRRARRIVANKRLIIATIGEISPTTAEQILCTLYPCSDTKSSGSAEAEPTTASCDAGEPDPAPVAARKPDPAPAAARKPEEEFSSSAASAQPGLRWPPVLLAGGIVLLVAYLVWAFTQII